MTAATSCTVSGYGSAASASTGSSAGGRRSRVVSRLAISHVVGLHRLEPAGLQAPTVGVVEDQRGRRVAHGAIGVRGFALELGRSTRRGADERAVILVGGLHGAVVQAADQLRGARHAGERRGQPGVGVELQRGGEARELERAEDRQLERWVGQPGRHHGATRAARRHVPRPRPRVERHPVAAEAQVAGCPGDRRVATRVVLCGVLGQPDQRQPPGQLGAVAPLQHGQRRRGRPRPRAAGIAGVQDRDHSIDASG